VVLGITGAVLIALESIYQIAYGSSLVTLNGLGLAYSVRTLGVFGAFESVLLVVFCVLLFEYPHLHKTCGVALLTLAVLSLFSGGGLLLGTLCSYVAGVLSVFLFPVPRRRPTAASLRDSAEDPVAEADVLDSLRSP
jgi:hypothetical protein